MNMLSKIGSVFGLIFSNISTRVWFIVTCILMVLLITLNVVCVQWLLVYNTLNAVFGGESMSTSGNSSEYTYFEGDYETKEEAMAAAAIVNESIAAEGIVLLENDNDTLPLDTSSKISVFGKNSVNIVYGGSGSAGGNIGDAISLYDALEEEGFSLNPTLESFYNDTTASGVGRDGDQDLSSDALPGLATGETPQASYTSAVKDSYASYNDVALVVISRVGGEAFDLPRTMLQSDWATPVTGVTDGFNQHYLELDDNEEDLLAAIQSDSNFDSVVVMMNTAPQTFEMGFIEDYDKIDSVIWCGGSGRNGMSAFAKTLSGEYNPSGNTVDIMPYDFTIDPTWQNFGSNLTETGNTYLSETYGADIPTYYVDYEEGIYVGYRYYETAGLDDKIVDVNNNTTLTYDEAIKYPFGYGLSYTEFSQTIKEVNIPDGSELEADDTIEVTVEVTNNGDTDGKDIVQIYYTAPYTTGGIEKSHVVLGGFAKTDMLTANGGTSEVTIEMTVRDMASYDYNDANSNSFKGYELDEGDYEIKLMENSHEVIDSVTYSVPTGGYKYATDEATGHEIENLFDDVVENEKSIETFMSRSDFEGTFPTAPTLEDRAVSDEFFNSLTVSYSSLTASDSTQKWYTEDMPTTGASNDIDFSALIGSEYDDELWDDFLDQMTAADMAKLIGTGVYSTTAFSSYGIPASIHGDGPVGFTPFFLTATAETADIYDTYFYASGVMIASTYNTSLGYDYGVSVGNESLVGDVRDTGLTYSGWYAPAANIHRSQFGGRNWEYMSEDGMLSGKFCATIIQGAKSKGVYTQMKHFALNDQDTNRESGAARGGLMTWSNEQAMREIYFVPFEYAVKEGETMGIMSSFNRIGTTWAGGSYALLTELLRDEWGFCGMVITDYNTPSYPYMNTDLMIRAGGDLSLSQDICPTSSGTLSATQVTCLRKATKNVLWTLANSNAMNGFGDGVSFTMGMPTWRLIMICISVAIIVACAAWGFLIIRKIKSGKEEKASDAE